jgi:protein-tyrosine phosphatase
MPLVINWRAAEQPSELVRPVVEALDRGELVVLPTESGYVVAGNADHGQVIDRLKNGPIQTPESLVRLVPSLQTVKEFSGELSRAAERIVSRLWPGSLGLQTPVRAQAQLPNEPWENATIRGFMQFRQPLHSALDALWATGRFRSLIASEEIRVTGNQEFANALAEKWGDGVAVAIDAGAIVEKAITWLRIDESSWKIEREGSVPEAEVIKALAKWIVFVCTGNTCRSPMAEALFKTKLAEKLGCEIQELTNRGYRVFSAGVSAYPGDGPSPDAVDVLQEMGADLSAHRSQPLAIEAVAFGDQLIAMTRSHLLAVLSRYPAIGGSMRLLCGGEGDLDDPIGREREVYQACAKTILRHVDRLMQEIVC